MTLLAADQICQAFCARNPRYEISEAIVTVRYYRDKDLAELGRLRAQNEKLEAHVKQLLSARAQGQFDID